MPLICFLCTNREDAVGYWGCLLLLAVADWNLGTVGGASFISSFAYNMQNFLLIEKKKINKYSNRGRI